MTTRRSRFTLIATAGSAIALATAAPPAATAADPGYVFDSPSVLEISEPDATTVTFTYRNGTTETRRSCGVTVSSAEWMTGYRDAVLDADDVAAASMVFGADSAPRDLEPSTLSEPAIVDDLRRGWRRAGE